MADWKLWRDMARESIRAARMMEKEYPRSSISRYYYASFQIVTAVLLTRGDLTPPDGREAWNHENTPMMVHAHFGSYVKSRKQRNEMVSQLAHLYKMRVLADYVSQPLSGTASKLASKYSTFLARISESILREGEED